MQVLAANQFVKHDALNFLTVLTIVKIQVIKQGYAMMIYVVVPSNQCILCMDANTQINTK